MAAQQACQCHPGAGPQSEAFDRLVAEFRTRREMPALEANQRRQRVPVNLDKTPAEAPRRQTAALSDRGQLIVPLL